MSRATLDFEIVNYIVYYRRGGEKTRSDTVVYISCSIISDGSNFGLLK